MADHEAQATPGGFWAVITSPQARKAQVAIVGVLLSLVTAGLIPPDIGVWITTIVSALVAAGVFATPNLPQKLILQPQGTTPKAADVVVEVSPEAKDQATNYAGDVKG